MIATPRSITRNLFRTPALDVRTKDLKLRFYSRDSGRRPKGWTLNKWIHFMNRGGFRQLAPAPIQTGLLARIRAMFAILWKWLTASPIVTDRTSGTTT